VGSTNLVHIKGGREATELETLDWARKQKPWEPEKFF
jgi:cyclase